MWKSAVQALKKIASGVFRLVRRLLGKHNGERLETAVCGVTGIVFVMRVGGAGLTFAGTAKGIAAFLFGYIVAYLLIRLAVRLAGLVKDGVDTTIRWLDRADQPVLA